MNARCLVAGLVGACVVTLPLPASSSPVAKPVNRAPIARTDHLIATVDLPKMVLWRQLLGNDSPGRGEEGQLLRVVGVTDDPDSPGTVFVTGGHAVFVPEEGFVGTARFRYTIRDDGGTRRGGDDTDSGWVRVTVEP